MSAPAAEDELQDLSPDDARELRLFLDKRRWFEAKLKILESLPPIYPFLHPVLCVPSTDRATTPSRPVYDIDIDGDASLSLPSEEQLRKWQDERTALEEQVLAFDGGDLGRMKDKTRAATLLPLTPPSTHLVSITLALIVVIDRLLTLLRHRLELLELTSLRLQWDSLRWQILQETARVRADIDELARGHGDWMPPLAREIKPTRRLERSSTVDSLASESSFASTSTPRGRRAGSILDSPTASSPGQGTRIPLLHSHITNVEIRQKNLTTTMLSRSGKLLDRMIDVAIPLKGLGGIHGPSDSEASDEEKEDSGAVPDELLDIQDDLDNAVGELAKRVVWCRKLEDEWTRADAHHLASSRSLQAAEEIYTDLQEAISEPPSKEQHTRLLEDLGAVQNLLPAAIGDTFPRPSHPDYPEQDARNSTMLETLTSTHAQAASSIRKCADGIEWYARLLEATKHAADAKSAVEGETNALRTAWEALQVGNDSFPRPDLDNPGSLGSSVTSWLETLPALLVEEKDIRARALKANQQLSLATIKLRQVVRSPPKSICDEVDPKHSVQVLDQAESVGDALSELARQSVEMAKVVEDEAKIIPLAWGVLESVKEIRSRLDNEEQGDNLDLDRLEQAASTIRHLQKDHGQKVARPITEIGDILKSQGRRLPALSSHLADLSDVLLADLSRVRKDVDRCLARAKQQAAVSAIEEEARAFQEEGGRLQISIAELASKPYSDASQVADLAPQDVKDKVEGVRRRVEDWTSGLSSRVSFLTLAEKNDSSSDVDQYQRDQEARARVNDASSRVAAAVEHLVDDIAYLPLSSWTAQIRQAISRLDNDIATAGETISQLEETHTSQGSDIELLDNHRDAIQSGVSHLTKLVGAEQGLPAIKDHDEHEALLQDVERVLSSASDVLLLLEQASQQSEEGSPTAEEMEAKARESLDHLGRLRLHDIVWPTTQAIGRDPTLRQLPTPALAKDVAREADSILVESEQLIEPDTEEEAENAKERRSLLKAVESAHTSLTRLDTLVTVARTISACDEAFSRLLDACDEYAQTEDGHKLESINSQASAALRAVRAAAEDVVGDVRVRTELGRLQASWAELDALVEETLHPDQDALESLASSSEVSYRPSSAASTTRSISRSTSRIEPSSATSATSQETVKSPFPSRLPQPTQTPRPASAAAFQSPGPRIRAASDTPTRSFRSLGSSTGLPRMRKTSLGPRLTSPFPTSPSVTTLSAAEEARTLTPVKGPRASLPSISSSRNLSSSIGPSATPRVKARLSSAGATQTGSAGGRKSTGARKTYVPDPKSKLDVAVGKIVNKLNVHVPIRPVGLDVNAPKIKDEWKDQSGRYWIGAEGRAKLCFCRILRSKTVMVRVGGGWVELSKFLLDHFADQFVGWNPSASGLGLGIGFGSSTPVPITSASLATPARPRHSNTRPTTPSSHATPSVSRGQGRVTSTSKTPRRPAIPTFVTPGTAEGETTLADMLLSPTPHPHPSIPTVPTQTGSPTLTSVDTAAPSFEPKTPEPRQTSILAHSTSSTIPLTPSPNQSTTASPSSQGAASPLVPLHFMRKASESPPVRQKEKEQLNLGKRSILGRSSSGNVLLPP